MYVTTEHSVIQFSSEVYLFLYLAFIRTLKFVELLNRHSMLCIFVYSCYSLTLTLTTISGVY